jgi:hypothetical protein
MATSTSPGLPQHHDQHDRLRAAAPVLSAVGVLLAVLLGGALLARDLVELGLTFMTNR